MPGIDLSLAFFATALLLGITPGPDIIFVLTQSALFGVRAGMITTLGLVTGICFHTAIVALGLAVIFQNSPLAFNLLKCAGAAYLCWLAWQSFRAGASCADTGEKAPFPGYGQLYRRGIIMNVTNPKVSLFFLAFLPQFCNPQAGPLGWQIVFFGVLFMLATIIVFFTVALMGGKVAIWFNKSARAQILMHKIAGLVFLGLALALVMADQ